jgi:alpha-tubulin suppressor-like RCC1 family protein
MTLVRFARISALFGWVLVIPIIPVAARATVGRDLRIRWAGERPSPAQAGREFVGRFEMLAGTDGFVEGLDVVGKGWVLEGMDAAPRLAMTRGQRRVVTFRATTENLAEPLTVRCLWQGRLIEKSIRLDAASLDRKGRRVVFDGQGPRLSSATPRLSDQGVSAQQIHFSGRFRYTRGDGIPMGADHIVIKIWDDDPISDELIWSGQTDLNGYFDVVVDWDDCDISGCDDPDVYVEVVASGAEADVEEDDLLQTTYSWETPITGDFTGNAIDFGTFHPDDSVEDGAVHLYSSVVKAHRFASDLHGMNPGPVEVLWPDYDDASKYDAGAEEIHIQPDDEWDELVVTHEFGHHLHNIFGNLLEPDYNNGYCDTPEPSHCVWCPEHVGEGWQEGFADWFGQVVTESYNATYGIVPWCSGTNSDGTAREPLYGLDGLGSCPQDSQFHPGAETEGYVMALLRDIQDATNDDEDGGASDCDKDAMSLGSNQILTVFKNDDPTDIGMFINSFRAHYPEYDQDLWSTIRNEDPGMGFALPDPIVLTQPAPCKIARAGESVTLNAVGNGSLLTYQWRRGASNLADGSGVSGATASTLFLSPVTAAMGGSYDCVVTTCDGTKSVMSVSQQLTVIPAPFNPRPYLTWGENYNAQCGNGTIVDWLPPGTYTGLTNVVQASGGRAFSMALKSDGTVYTWGRVEGGELGNGYQYSNTYSPQQIAVSGAIQIEAGNGHALALLRDGTVVGWGTNFWGDLGDGTQTLRVVPSPTLFSGCIVALAAGHDHTLALRKDGTVMTSGYNQFGELGRTTPGSWSITPDLVPGLTNVVAIAAAGYWSMALRSDGTVWTWGYNVFGELGNGTTTNSTVPVQVIGLTNIRSIAASFHNGYAVRSTGEVYAWGSGGVGAIGDGNYFDRSTPVLIPSINNPVKVVAGDVGWAAALLQDGTLRAWGYNYDNVLATGAIDGSYRPIPEVVLNAVSVTDIYAGYVTAHVLGHFVGVTAVETPAAEQPPAVLALRVAPVPSNASTSLAFDLPSPGRVTIGIYDLSGRLVRPVLADSRPAGRHTAQWDGRTSTGAAAPAGIYFVRLEGSGDVVTRRIVLVR